ncbi:hypothetical protein [Denitrobaculum tricleocarpae]|uniref:DUF4760 domain-containing protein n=1 Tax=Denitrobaculum tricleocarpae TaxID=2591009 RepID=A0A545U2X4_9PROT|nr:hypothetical protein [Denitrobaculum tricleocarpae]TQV83832.1 hypothetical protein FKG95_04430 [Denitrobaculum tricleocarpae]
MSDLNSELALVTTDPRVLGAVVAGVATLAVFTASKVYDVWVTAKVKRDSKRRLINALYTEIGHNKEELIKAVEKSPSTAALMRALAEDDRRTVHMVYARNMRFFEDLKGELHVLPSALLGHTVKFYNCLESVYAQMDGFERESFKTMTPAGKRATMENLIEKMLEATALASLARGQFEAHFDHLRD